jgi:hypothetical protein
VAALQAHWDLWLKGWSAERHERGGSIAGAPSRKDVGSVYQTRRFIVTSIGVSFKGLDAVCDKISKIPSNMRSVGNRARCGLAWNFISYQRINIAIAIGWMRNPKCMFPVIDCATCYMIKVVLR